MAGGGGEASATLISGDRSAVSGSEQCSQLQPSPQLQAHAGGTDQTKPRDCVNSREERDKVCCVAVPTEETGRSVLPCTTAGRTVHQSPQ